MIRHRGRRPMNRTLFLSTFSLFFGKFLKHGTKIASLAPSSPWLSRATVGNVDWAKAEVVVELGAGTGPITRVIAERARPETRVVVLERDPDFAAILRDRFAEAGPLRRDRRRRPRPGRRSSPAEGSAGSTT